MVIRLTDETALSEPGSAKPPTGCAPMNGPRSSPSEIRRACTLLCTPGEVYELRALNTERATISGYFTDVDRLVKAAVECSDQYQADGVYSTLNPVNRALFARCANAANFYSTARSREGVARAHECGGMVRAAFHRCWKFRPVVSRRFGRSIE
jgi:hypothetical protein